MSWQSAWLVLLLVAARFLLRRQIAPAMLFAGWLVVAVMLLMPLRLPVPWDPLGLGRTAKMRTPMTAPTVVIQEEVAPNMMKPAWPIQALGPVDAEAAARFRAEAVNFDVFDVSVSTTRNFIGDLALVWLAGMAVLLSLRAVALLRFHGRLQGTRLPVDGVLEQAVRESCAELGLTQMPAVVVTPMVGTPALCGLFRPRLLFPAGFSARLTAEELRWVVRHELGHLQRRDLPAQALLQLACAVHWFNPLVWLAAKLARHDCELACDDHVLRRARAEDGADYGRTLIRVLGRTVGRNRLPAAVGIVEGRRQLMKRITWISDYRPQSRWHQIVGAGLLLGVTFIGATRAAYTETAKPIATRTQSALVSAPVRIPVGEAEPGQSTAVAFPMSAEQQAARAARQAEIEAWERDVAFELCGIGRVGGVPVALIAVNGNLVAAVRGSRLVNFFVLQVDVESSQVSIGKEGWTTRVLTLTERNPIQLPEVNDRTLEFLISKEGVKRMNEHRSMSPELSMVWDELSREGQAKVLISYLLRGWVVGSITMPSGGTGYASRLYAQQISQRSGEARDRFLASLTAEQRDEYGSLIQEPIRLTDSPDVRERALAAHRAAEARRAQVVAGLTPTQRELYDEWQSWSGR